MYSKELTASFFRSRKSNPSEFPAGGNLTAIPKGTFVDGDHWQYTFVCKGCLAGTTGFATTAAEDRLAFAMSNNPPAQAANKASQLNFHNAGTGQFMLKLGDAKSDKYAAWSKLV
jgi:hypothetical protein